MANNNQNRSQSRTNPENMEEVFYVLQRRRRGGQTEYCVGSNFMPRPRGWRQEWGTSSLCRDVVMDRVRACQQGMWWDKKRKRNIALGNCLRNRSKAIHEAYKKSRKKETFDWTKIKRLTLDF